MTRLDKPLKRELQIKGKPHVLTIDPEGLRLTKKGRRKGIEIAPHRPEGSRRGAHGAQHLPR